LVFLEFYKLWNICAVLGELPAATAPRQAEQASTSRHETG
jgi:hypothetical protein